MNNSQAYNVIEYNKLKTDLCNCINGLTSNTNLPGAMIYALLSEITQQYYGTILSTDLINAMSNKSEEEQNE